MQDKPKCKRKVNQQRKFSRTFVILGGLMLGILAAGMVFLTILIATRPSASNIEQTATYGGQLNQTTIALGLQTATAAAQSTLKTSGTPATLAPCAYSWASRDEPELTAIFEDRLSQLTTIAPVTTFTMNVRTLGEDCNRGAGTTPVYGIMQTEITITVQVDSQTLMNDLDTAYTNLQPPTLAILQTLAEYPMDDLPGPDTTLLIDFNVTTQNGPTTYRLVTSQRTILAVLDAGALESQEFFEQLGGLTLQ